MFMALVLIVSLSLLEKSSPDYVYRSVTNHFAEVYNEPPFENPINKKNVNVLKLKKKPDNAFIDSVFVNRLLQSGLDKFNQWAEKANTTTRAFVRKDSVPYEKYFDRFIKNVNEAMLHLKR